jgi:hypothetical protein
MNEIIATQDIETQRFELVQREAKALMTSDLLPVNFKGNIGNVLIAMEYAKRLDMPPLAVMQSMYVIHGKPSFDAKFFISQIVKRYGQIHYDLTGQDDEKTCFVWVTDLENGEKITGPEVSIAMAKKEGWYGKSGSKWQTMPDLMLRYRAAAFFARTYLPDLILGLQSVDEIRDIEVDHETGEVKTVVTRGVRGLKQRLVQGDIDATAD